MLFGNAYKPKGLLAQFAPTGRNMTPAADPTPDIGTGMMGMAAPMVAPQPKKHDWLKIAIDGLSGMAGQQGPFADAAAAQQERDWRAQQMEANRKAQMEQWVAQEQWKRDNPAPVNNDTVNDYNFILQQSGPEAANQYLQGRYDPIVNMPLPDGRMYVGPRSQAPGTIGGMNGGGGQSPMKPVGKLTPIGGGVGGNPGGGFPVGANALDRVTVQSESAGNPNAVSPKGAMGLWQVMPGTARDPGFGITPWKGGQADLNRVGAEYRRAMEKRYGGDLAKMWAAYNWGPGNLDEALRKYGANWMAYAPSETKAYVARNLRAVRGSK